MKKVSVQNTFGCSLNCHPQCPPPAQTDVWSNSSLALFILMEEKSFKLHEAKGTEFCMRRMNWEANPHSSLIQRLALLVPESTLGSQALGWRSACVFAKCDHEETNMDEVLWTLLQPTASPYSSLHPVLCSQGPSHTSGHISGLFRLWSQNPRGFLSGCYYWLIFSYPVPQSKGWLRSQIL